MAVNYSAGLLACRAFFFRNTFLTHCWSLREDALFAPYWCRWILVSFCGCEIALLDFLEDMKRPAASPAKGASKAAKKSDAEEVKEKKTENDPAGEVADIFRSRFFLLFGYRCVIRFSFDLVFAFPSGPAADDCEESRYSNPFWDGRIMKWGLKKDGRQVLLVTLLPAGWQGVCGWGIF